MSQTLDLAIDLMRRASVTPADAGCQEDMIGRLQAIGFNIERLPFGDVTNFWARRGDSDPTIGGRCEVYPLEV